MLSPVRFIHAESYQRLDFPIPGTITGVYFPDVNGDGERDLLVVHHVNDADFTRRLTLFIRKHGTFRDTMKLKIPVDPHAIAFDFGDVNGDGAEEFIFLGKIGFEALAWDGSRFQASPKPVLLPDGFLQTPDPKNLPRLPVIFQRDSIQYPILLLPHQQGLALMQWNGKTWEIQKILYAPPQGNFTPDHTLQFQMPQIGFLDFNQDGEKDVFVPGRELRVFLMNPVIPSDLEICLPDYVYPLDMSHIPLSSMEKVSPITQTSFLCDLDHDGAADLVIAQAPKGGWTHAASHVQIYKNTFGHLEHLPAQILQGENLTGRIHIRDLNNDGFEDLVVERQSLSIKQAIRFLFSQKIKIGFDIYLMSDSLYSETPDYQTDFSQEAASDWMAFHLPVSFDGDWNGDAIPDLLIQTKPGAFAIVPGTGAGFDKTAMLYLPDMPTGHFEVCNDPPHFCMLAAWNEWPVENQHVLTLFVSRYEKY